MIAGIEWLIVVAIIGGVVIFGGKKLPEFAKSFGKARVEYEKAKLTADKEIADLKKSIT